MKTFSEFLNEDTGQEIFSDIYKFISTKLVLPPAFTSGSKTELVRHKDGNRYTFTGLTKEAYKVPKKEYEKLVNSGKRIEGFDKLFKYLDVETLEWYEKKILNKFSNRIVSDGIDRKGNGSMLCFYPINRKLKKAGLQFAVLGIDVVPGYPDDWEVEDRGDYLLVKPTAIITVYSPSQIIANSEIDYDKTTGQEIYQKAVDAFFKSKCPLLSHVLWSNDKIRTMMSDGKSFIALSKTAYKVPKDEWEKTDMLGNDAWVRTYCKNLDEKILKYYEKQILNKFDNTIKSSGIELRKWDSSISFKYKNIEQIFYLRAILDDPDNEWWEAKDMGDYYLVNPAVRLYIDFHLEQLPWD